MLAKINKSKFKNYKHHSEKCFIDDRIYSREEQVSLTN